jgi:hypothetical protein
MVRTIINHKSDAAQVVLVGISGRLNEVALHEDLILQDNAMGYETKQTGVTIRKVLQVISISAY